MLITKEVVKRSILEFVIFALLAVIYMGWSDYNYMDQQMSYVRAGQLEDVFGYEYNLNDCKIPVKDRS